MEHFLAEQVKHSTCSNVPLWTEIRTVWEWDCFRGFTGLSAILLIFSYECPWLKSETSWFVFFRHWIDETFWFHMFLQIVPASVQSYNETKRERWWVLRFVNFWETWVRSSRQLPFHEIHFVRFQIQAIPFGRSWLNDRFSKQRKKPILEPSTATFLLSTAALIELF